MKPWYRKFRFVTFLLVFCFALSACRKTDGEIKKLKDLEFTVVEDADLPEKLMNKVEQKKANPFKFTYSNEDYLYIVQGYGGQKSGGFSISVNELFLTENAIYIKTNLIGPGKDEPVTQNITYPYVVVKLEYMDKPVYFK